MSLFPLQDTKWLRLAEGKGAVWLWEALYVYMEATIGRCILLVLADRGILAILHTIDWLTSRKANTYLSNAGVCLLVQAHMGVYRETRSTRPALPHPVGAARDLRHPEVPK